MLSESPQHAHTWYRVCSSRTSTLRLRRHRTTRSRICTRYVCRCGVVIALWVNVNTCSMQSFATEGHLIVNYRYACTLSTACNITENHADTVPPPPGVDYALCFTTPGNNLLACIYSYTRTADCLSITAAYIIYSRISRYVLYLLAMSSQSEE